jgi:hypothetical protein
LVVWFRRKAEYALFLFLGSTFVVLEYVTSGGFGRRVVAAD